MRDNLRRRPAARGVRAIGFDANAEARAVELLMQHRGKPAIKAAPSAGKIAAAILRPLLPQKASAVGLAELKRRWREIIANPDFYAATEPEKLAGGVLTLRVTRAHAIKIQQHGELFAQRCRLAGANVTKIAIVQGSVNRLAQPAGAAKSAPQPGVSAEQEARLEEGLSGIENEALRAALLRLGRAIAR